MARKRNFLVAVLSLLFSREWLVNAAVTGLLLLVIEYDVLVLTPDDTTAMIALHVLLGGIIVIRVKWDAIQTWVEDEADINVEE